MGFEPDEGGVHRIERELPFHQPGHAQGGSEKNLLFVVIAVQERLVIVVASIPFLYSLMQHDHDITPFTQVLPDERQGFLFGKREERELLDAEDIPVIGGIVIGFTVPEITGKFSIHVQRQMAGQPVIGKRGGLDYGELFKGPAFRNHRGFQFYGQSYLHIHSPFYNTYLYN